MILFGKKELSFLESKDRSEDEQLTKEELIYFCFIFVFDDKFQ